MYTAPSASTHQQKDSPMETASSSSCSVLHGLSYLISGPLSSRLSFRRHFLCHRTATPSRDLRIFRSPSSPNLTCRSNGLVSQPARLISAFSSLSSEQQSAELGVLLEVEGYWPCLSNTFSLFKIIFFFC